MQTCARVGRGAGGWMGWAAGGRGGVAHCPRSLRPPPSALASPTEPVCCGALSPLRSPTAARRQTCVMSGVCRVRPYIDLLRPVYGSVRAVDKNFIRKILAKRMDAYLSRSRRTRSVPRRGARGRRGRRPGPMGPCTMDRDRASDSTRSRPARSWHAHVATLTRRAHASRAPRIASCSPHLDTSHARKPH